MRAAAFLTAVAALVAPSVAAGAVHFRTPSGNIGCYADRSSLRCDIGRTDFRSPPPPASCDFDYGNAFAMRAAGVASRICHSDTVLGARRVLRYGQTLRIGAFTCSSATSGLTCRNAARHGWFLSRERVRLF
jgi:hypothetical protein